MTYVLTDVPLADIIIYAKELLGVDMGNISMMTMHEYDFFKFLWTTVITLFMMLLIVFAIFLCSILLTQLKTFLEAIVTELKYR